MEFSEKLKTLLSLTASKSVSLANYVNIDTAQISRMKTGARKMPRDAKLLRDISEYIAGRLDNEYRLSALYELTGDVRLQSAYSSAVLTDIVYDWLTAEDGAKHKPTGQFLRRLNDISDEKPSEPIDSKTKCAAASDDEFMVFTKNDGKRQAASRFFDSIMACDKPGTIRFFSDESDSWMMENAAYMRKVTDSIKAFTLKGFRVQRVQPPARGIESTFRDIERWLPAYVAGTLKMFNYPWARDELHRKTIFVLPGRIALYSSSLCGQTEAQATILTTNKELVDSLDNYFSGIIERSRTMINVYTLDDKERVIERIKDISQAFDDGVYKSHCLSAHTLPSSVIHSVSQRTAPFTQKVMECYGSTESFKADVLERYVIIDIMSLPKLENVLNGVEPVPGTSTGGSVAYYTPEEYCAHLEHIIWYLETYPKYRAVFLDTNELENVVIYTKGCDYAIIIKELHPFTLFEIVDRGLTTSVSAYLRQLGEKKTYDGARQMTLDMLRKEIELARKGKHDG